MIDGRVSISVRKAKLADAESLIGIFRDAWTHAYAGIIPALHLSRLIQRRDKAWWRAAIRSERHLLVLEVAGRIVGYATCGMARSVQRECGEIYELYVTPVYQGIGLGQHLFEACRHRMDLDSLDGLIVWALADNQEAGDFYWRRGGRPTASAKEWFSGKELEKVGYSWG